MNNNSTADPIIRFPTQSESFIIKKFSYCDSLIYTQDNSIWVNEAIENKRILIAEINSHVCGMITWDYIFQNTVPLVTWLYIIEEYRHGSLTRLLTKSLYDHLRQQGYTRLLYGMHESVKDPSTIAPHGFLEWPGKGKENIYWMKLA